MTSYLDNLYAAILFNIQCLNAITENKLEEGYRDFHVVLLRKAANSLNFALEIYNDNDTYSTYSEKMNGAEKWYVTYKSQHMNVPLPANLGSED